MPAHTLLIYLAESTTSNSDLVHETAKQGTYPLWRESRCCGSASTLHHSLDGRWLEAWKRLRVVQTDGHMGRRGLRHNAQAPASPGVDYSRCTNTSPAGGRGIKRCCCLVGSTHCGCCCCWNAAANFVACLAFPSCANTLHQRKQERHCRNLTMKQSV